MKIEKQLKYLVCGILALASASTGAEELRISPDIDHSAWNELLSEYVNQFGLVDYGRWKSDIPDLTKLDRYLEQFAIEADPYAEGSDLAASLVNAYNAFTVQWILENYPTQSIRELKKSWTGKRYWVSGYLLSLDDIENAHLRPLIGWKVHALIVCAARSCPPLKNSSYSRADFPEEIKAAYRNWLGRIDLNRFNPLEEKIELSLIFKWFAEDFEKGRTVDQVLRAFAPDKYRSFVESGDYKTVYKKYRWGLNDQSELGDTYK